MIIKSVDFIAKLYYRKAEEGGRNSPAFSGYRPGIKFPFAEMQTSGQQTFVNKEKVYPGEIVEAEIKIVSVDFFKHQLYEGLEFDFREGSTIIGTGVILKIINSELLKTSA